MDTKTGLMVTGAFVMGICTGAAAGYLITKKSCDMHTQEAIDEMKVEHKKEIDNLKKENANEEKKTESEDIVKIDKPSITEMSSLVNSYNNNSFEHSKFDYVKLKESIRKETQEKPEEKKEPNKEKQIVIDYGKYMNIDEGYFEKTFAFDTDTGMWSDMEVGSEYDSVDNLPFDTDIVEWADGQCYILDESDKSIYILEKV